MYTDRHALSQGCEGVDSRFCCLGIAKVRASTLSCVNYCRWHFWGMHPSPLPPPNAPCCTDAFLSPFFFNLQRFLLILTFPEAFFQPRSSLLVAGPATAAAPLLPFCARPSRSAPLPAHCMYVYRTPGIT